MKGLILAGGSGTRLRPFSHALPKQLVPVANKPVLAHAVETLREAGITEIAVVVNGHADQIRRVLSDGSPFGVEITYLPQPAPLGLAHCVQLAQEFLGSDDFVMYLGDNILADGIADQLAEFRRHRPAAQVLAHKVMQPQMFGVVEVDADGYAIRFVEKPTNPRSDLAVVGVYFFRSAIHAAVAAIRPSSRGELEITDALQWLVEQGAEVTVRTYAGFWCDTGTPADLLECNRELLTGTTPGVFGQVDQESALVGPVTVAAGARVVRSRITGPAVVGPGAMLVDSEVGPYTSIGADCVLNRAGAEYSILLPGATVTSVGGVHSSIIGRGATVAAAPTGRHQFLVADDSIVEVKTP